MAWRFKASKYKNAAPIVPKPENYVRDISVGSYQTYGNNIAASAKFMAFNWDHAGSSLAVLPLDDYGRKGKLMPLLHAHSDTVTDISFSPFHDGLLATGSQDCLVKIWHIPKEGLQESLSNPESTFSHKQRRVEIVGFHPTADFLLHSTSFTTLTLWDLMTEQEIFSNSDPSEVIQSVSWKRDGTLLATSAKDKQVRILDPRAENCCVQSANSHPGIKDSKVVWLGDQNKILTTGFDAQRLRQVIIRDLRNIVEPEKTLELDCSTGILIPLYDADTGMLFLAGKGDTTILYMEVTDKDPHLIEGIRHSGEQTKGVCLVPKRALNIMQGEVNRILQLTSSSVVPVTYQVPRKTYRDFHADIYPDTPGYKTDLVSSDWFQGTNIPLQKMSLDPAKREHGEEPIVIHRGTLQEMREEYNNRKITAKPEPKAKPALAQKIEHHPVKGIIKDFEKDNKQMEASNKQIEASNKLIEASNKLIEEEKNNINMKSTEDDGDKIPSIIPPKPLPRTSRTSSMCDSQPAEDANSAPKPVARPRTNSCVPVVTSVSPVAPVSGGYKPRLGPKPFTPPNLADTENTFSKVFSVPAVPGQTTTSFSQEKDKSPTVEEIPEKTEAVNGKSEENHTKSDVGNGKSASSGEEEASSDSGYVPRTPSTAERRKLFETKPNSKENDTEELDSVDFERGSLQRASIAERRKMYESRSISVQEQGLEKKENSPVMMRRKDSFKNRKNAEDLLKDDNNRKSMPIAKQQSLDPVGVRKSEVSMPTPKRTSTVFGRVSKFRHLKGTPLHKSFHIENIRNLSRQIPGECDGFQANPERVAVPLSGPGGKIAIFELSKTGKLPDGVIPALVHGNSVMDFTWDPFDTKRLAVACDDGVVKLWRIPDNGLTEQTNEAEAEFCAHSDKIYFIKFHPTAKDVLASGSYDMTIKLWDLSTLMEKIVLKGHTDQIFSFAWSPCGSFCATVSKDSKIRIYKPRSNDSPIREGKGPEGNRGARITWALDGHFIVATGFDKVSERQITAYKANDLSNPLNTVGLDVSPAILIPFYDDDSSTLFVTGKGDSTIYAFEITEEHPFICPLSHHRCPTLHQGLSFLSKNVCDVSNVEFAKALRLTNNSIEPLSFTVPRIKTDLFQDDLFPPTRVTWNPTMSSSEWFSGKEKPPQKISLQPEGMELLSESQGQPNSATERTINKSASSPFIGINHGRVGWDVDASDVKNKQDEIKRSVSNKLQVNKTLEQDAMEGVDEKEWLE
ncbi:coronin-7 isoform X1 [Diabrotica virgifera virgifera]|uniref:Coronin n=1 Tax=Diabrotica virgifera virgifera TaxID=50390 RepID=A0ABM5JJM4_DIAVI|nr:coronin-7 isoform X1 [Diabrotica virgifera virgifera]